MTTYNTYQEAKIANPDKEIIRFDKQDEFKAVSDDELSAYLTTWTKCNPADHCMTVEKFLAYGHKTVNGDWIIDYFGNVWMNMTGSGAHNVNNFTGNKARESFILRAAALEKIPTETPEEKEVLDGIESAGCVEWNGDGLPPVGVECEALDFDDDTWRLVKVLDAKTSSKEVAVTTISNIGIFGKLFWATNFRKPETPQQREDRERLEAAYDLYCEWVGNRTGYHAIDFDEWSVEPDYFRRWLRVVDKANYRKEKTHGTN